MRQREVKTEAIANGRREIKMFFYLKKICVGATTVTAILIVGCGQVPTGDSSKDAGQVEALRKEAASLKSKLASAQAAIDSLRL